MSLSGICLQGRAQYPRQSRSQAGKGPNYFGGCGYGHDDRAHFIAAVDDLALFVWFDHAGIVGFQHRLLTVDDDGQFTAQHEIDFFRR